MEIWKPIIGFINYEVSNLGGVKRLDSYVRTNMKGDLRFQKGRINKIATNTIGYKNARLWHEGVEHTFGVHVLVARNFIPNPDNKPDVNHKNGIRDDNRVENLEWATGKEQQLHAVKMGLRDKTLGSNNNFSKLNDKQVLEIRELYSTGNLFQREIAEIYGIAEEHCHRIINKKSWKHI